MFSDKRKKSVFLAVRIVGTINSSCLAIGKSGTQRNKKKATKVTNMQAELLVIEAAAQLL